MFKFLKKIIIFLLKNYVLLAHTLFLLILAVLTNGLVSPINILIISPLFLPIGLLYDKIFGNIGYGFPFLIFMWILAYYLDRLKNKLYYKWRAKKKI